MLIRISKLSLPYSQNSFKIKHFSLNILFLEDLKDSKVSGFNEKKSGNHMEMSFLKG